MATSPQIIRVVHLFSSFRALGGVESILRHHHERDHEFQLESRFVIYFEKEIEPVERVTFLGTTGRSTIRDVRRRLCAAIGKAPPDVAFYHGMWGMPYLAELDQAARRVVVLHGETPRTVEELHTCRGWIDGFLCIGEPVRHIVYASLPDLQRERATVAPVPVVPLAAPPETTAIEGRPMVLGFCSRLTVHQKRVDRLPQLCRHLDEHAIDYRFEFLGDGPDRPWLENQFPNRAKFIFHGRKSGEEYWRILRGWDAIVFVSDYEGTPVGMLEALSIGVIPIYPRINSGADALVQGLHPDFLYEQEKFDQVARALRHISSLRVEALDDLRRHCREAVAGHLGDNYLRKFASFAQEILALPRIGIAPFRKRPWPLNDLSLASLAWLGSLRRLLLRK